VISYLKKQAKSRAALDKAVAGYVNLRAGHGSHTTVVQTTDRAGRAVEVLVTLDIISGETT
jgi:hypothetical protein